MSLDLCNWIYIFSIALQLAAATMLLYSQFTVKQVKKDTHTKLQNPLVGTKDAIERQLNERRKILFDRNASSYEQMHFLAIIVLIGALGAGYCGLKLYMCRI